MRRFLPLLILVIGSCAAAPQTTEPEGPQTFLVRAGENPQQAVNKARPGDTILLENGVTYTGNLFLGPKQGDGWIEIRPVNTDFLPPDDQRVTPEHAAQMPKLLSNNTDPALGTSRAAHHYRITGIEIGVVPGRWNWNIVNIGSGQEKTVEEFPHTIVFDRVYVHGDPENGSVRGFALNGRNLEVRNSHIADFKRPNLDTQAIAVWNSPGQIRILNNRLEGAAENIIIGGSTPSILNMVPSDIEIRRNHFVKPLSWRESDPSFAGTAWSVKNLFEIKMGRKVTLDSNVLEYAWQHHQIGFAIVLTVRTENAAVPESVIEDIQITNNIIRHAGCGINILGTDDWQKGAGLGKTRRVTVRNNLFYDIGGHWGCGGRMFQMLNGAEEIEIDHNTIVRRGGSIFVADGMPHRGLRMTNNIISYGSYGVVGEGIPNGDRVLAHYFPGAEIRKNVLIDVQPNLRPPDNFFLRSYDDLPFFDGGNLDFRLDESSKFRGAATDGSDVGANIQALLDSVAGVIAGVPADRVPPDQRFLSPPRTPEAIKAARKNKNRSSK